MPAERTTMRHVREVLRLKFVGGVPIRETARRIGVAASTVRATIKRFQAAGLSWPLPNARIPAETRPLRLRERRGCREQVWRGGAETLISPPCNPIRLPADATTAVTERR